MYIVRFNGVDYVCVTFSQAVAVARKTVEHGETATLSKDSYVMFGTVLAQLAEFCVEQSEK